MKLGTGQIKITLTAAQVSEALSEFLIAHYGELMTGRCVLTTDKAEDGKGFGQGSSFVVTLDDDKTAEPKAASEIETPAQPFIPAHVEEHLPEVEAVEDHLNG